MGPLSDVRVLDLAGEPGMFAGRLLADLGADVIRIEPPGGDATRKRGPFLEGVDGPERSLYHQHFNRNKRDVTLDIRSREGLALMLRLAERSDALIETAAPGDMDAIGAGYEALRSRNPALLYVTITPFGQQGPMRNYRANDLVAVAMSGLMALNGMPEDPPNQPPAEQAYHMASLAAASGLLVALYGRERRPDRRGHRIDVSLQEAASMATLQHASANAYAWFKRIPARRGLTGVVGGRHLFQCKDGRWVSFIVLPYRWSQLLQWLQEEGIASELTAPQWEDPAYRLQHPRAQVEALEAIAGRYDSRDLFHEAQRRGHMVMPVSSVEDLLRDEQLGDRGYFVPAGETAQGRPLADGGPVPRMRPLSSGSWRAPRLGEHNVEVFEGLLGLTQDELALLRQRDII